MTAFTASVRPIRRDVSLIDCRSSTAARSATTFDVPLLAGEHVDESTGTGFVHTAPSHGREDFDIWMHYARELKARGIDTHIPYPVDADGKFTKDAPGFEGLRVITEKGEKGEANDAVIKALIDAGMLVARGKLKHQYPHSWRSKKPVIFRNTPQWFIAMDKDIADVPAAAASSPLPGGERPRAERAGEGAPTSPASFGAPHPTPSASTSPQRGEVKEASVGKMDSGLAPAGAPRNDIVSKAAKPGDTLRARALAAIKATRWVPPQGENRITGMIENRPDWVISRQRAWGVPITLFVRERAGDLEVLEDARVNQRIADAFEAEGADAWYAEGARERFLSGLVENPAEWEKIDDILDVWFDSARRTPSCWRTRRISPPSRACAARSTAGATPSFTSKAPTSIAAGFIPRCSNPAARAGARRSMRSSPTASRSTSRAAKCRSRSATRSRRKT